MTITLARLEKRTHSTPLMADEIAFAFAYARVSGQVRCVLSGAASAFGAGDDYDPAIDGDDQPAPVPCQDRYRSVMFSTCFAGALCVRRVRGCTMETRLLPAAMIRILYAAEATFSLPEAKRGIWPIQVLPPASFITSRKILEMCITGNTYQAAEVYEMGLQVYPRETIDDKQGICAGEVYSGNAPLAIRRLQQCGTLLKFEADRHITKAQL